jgi:transposase
MDHLAIDIGGTESQICLRSPSGEIKQERKVRTHDLPKLIGRLPKSRVVFEACAESHWLADRVIEAGHEFRVIAPTLVRSLGVGSRSTKNDRKDARVMSEVSCRIDLPSIYVPAVESRERKTLLSMRDALVGSRTSMINAVRGWMRGQALRIRSGAVETFPERVRKARPDSLPEPISCVLKTIEHLREQIHALELQLIAIAKKDDRCRRLMSTPGVGPMTAVAFVSTLDTTKRFESAHYVQAYLGLTQASMPARRSTTARALPKPGPLECAGCSCKQRM